jgi:hypothetical protein
MKEKFKPSDSAKESADSKDTKQGKKVDDKKNNDTNFNVNLKQKDAHDRLDQIHKSNGGKAEIQVALGKLLNSNGFDSEKRTYALTKHLQFERDSALSGKAGLTSIKQALSDLSKQIARLCECREGQILRSMALIQLYVECCSNIGPGAISILTSCLSSWFHSILNKSTCIVDGWIDPKDEKSGAEPKVPGKSKAERLQLRARELMEKAEKLKYRVKSYDYISKAAGFKPNALEIAVQEQLKVCVSQLAIFSQHIDRLQKFLYTICLQVHDPYDHFYAPP